MNNINILKKLNLGKYQLNKMKKNPKNNKLYKENLKLIQKYYKTKKNVKTIKLTGGGKVDNQIDILLDTVENLLSKKDVEIRSVKSSDIINQKNIKDLQLKYEFLEAIKNVLVNLLKLYVNTHVLNDIVAILSDQFDVISDVMHGKNSNKKLKTDEKILIKNILNNNERIHPNILSKIINGEKKKLDSFFQYVQMLDNTFTKFFVLNPKNGQYKLLWDYKTDTLGLKDKVIEIFKQNEEFDKTVDFKYLKRVLEENLNIFDGCFCNSKCNFQDKKDTAHWCYTQHERCKRGNQSKSFGNTIKTCNPYKNNSNKMTSVDRNFYKIGLHHNMVYKTNRAIICTTKVNGITKHTGDYKCPGGGMSVNDFLKLKKKEYRQMYRKVQLDYFKNLKKHLITELKN